MKKPWQIWTVFALCLLVAIPAMVWLSLQALELDQVRENDRLQTELARREAELQERVSSALWRMEWMMIPLVAQEAARPWYLYESFYQNGQPLPDLEGQSEETVPVSYGQPSPLLFQPSDFVVLHFQVTPDNLVTSPQRPVGKDCLQAMTCCGLTESEVDSNDQRLQEIANFIDYELMLYECPSDHLPDARDTEWMLHSGRYTQQPQQQQQKGQQQQQIAMQQESAPQDMSQFQDFSFIDQQLQSQAWADNELQSAPIISNTGPKQQVQQSRNISRGNSEFDKRRRSMDNYAMNQWMANNRFDPQMSATVSPTSMVREGVMRPIWLDDRLILARRVERDDQPVIQCCWLDWERIQEALKEEVADLLPDVHLQPLQNVEDVRLGHALATLPVQLDIDREAMIETLTLNAGGIDDSNLERSGIRMSLVIAWSGLALAAIAGAFMLHGVLRLSERRGAFVSAVTHELRTPLTTFRMYAEMLAEKMVPPDRQQKYAETLKVESERLSHLVENVLQFARLERTGKNNRKESVTLAGLLERFGDRLQRRVDRAGMKLRVDIDLNVMKQSMQTDPAAIEQILFNLVDNACKYARTAEDKTIELKASQHGNRMQVAVRDHGPGVAGSDRQRMFLPFRKSDQQAANTEQGVGLGLALCRRMARSLGGSLTLEDGQPGARFILDIPLN
ncbi:MAG: sensor histidine kinase [Pirellulaceae bacterium]